MNEKRRVDRSHPDFPEYKQKFEEIWIEMEQEEERVEVENRDFRGMDGPVAAVHKKYAKRITALQKQYEYLFVEEVGLI